MEKSSSVTLNPAAFAKYSGSGIDPLAATRARMRHIKMMAQLVAWCDILAREAFDARVRAPGVLEIREWAEWAANEACYELRAAHPDAAQLFPADPILDAIAEATEAALRNDSAGYRVARDKEAAARAAATT